MSEKKAELLDHMYDGIQEFDNPLPAWWSWLFIGTVVFSIGYWVYFHSNVEGRSSMEEFNRDVADDLRIRFAEIGTLSPDRATMLKYLDNPKWRVVGEIVFKTNCVSCHGDKAEGKVGPNLCDDNWKNVKKLEDIPTVVANGANGQAMPAWKNRLHPNELVLVSCYVASLRGSKPAGGKAPEGDVIPPWK